MQHGRLRKPFLAVATGLFCCTALTSPAFAADDEEPANGEIVVTGALDALPVADVGSVFGFEKTLVETPRSASTISAEQMERFGITDIYDLVAQAPGTFTNSFFGVGGALDIRGTPGEIYFRGVRRLDNPGNYPTPIGASDRIDIVRGPASPIFGPSKTGGYMNFVPKSARVKGGSLMSEPAGQISFTGGSWEKANLSANIRGPGKLGAQEFGYSLYAELEDSGSYYDNMSTKQTILQGSFDADVSSNIRIEFGGQYQNYKGQQNGGWNRLTQDLVDNGTYITGTAQSLDGIIPGTVADGQMSQEEINYAFPGGLSVFGGFQCGGNVFASSITDACYNSGDYTLLNLTNTGTTKLSRRKTLTGKDDRLDNRSTTLYFDTVFTSDGGLEIKNQAFYDSYENINENTYGFSQFHDSWVFEDKIVVSKTFENNAGKFSFQLSPSIRYTHFKHGEDFNYEYFHRVDLTVGYTPASDRLLSTECDCNYTSYVKGHYTDLAFAGLVDLDFNFGLDVTLGARYDHIKGVSNYNIAKMESDPGFSGASDTDGAWSWSASASYKLPFGLIPYATIARQSVVIAGQGAELDPENLAAGTWISASKLYEGGIKGSFLDDSLYAAVSVYKQERTDYSAQSITVNQAVQTKGLEAEFRWAVDDHLLVTGAYTRTKVYNLTAIENGTLFSFFGIEDLVNVSDPTLYLGGQPIGLVPINSKSDARRAGIPTNLYSLTATYGFDNGLALSASMVSVDSVYSGQSKAVKLPAYTLFDLGASYETGPWLFRLVVKNATNEKYFRANFTELFGSTIALPEKPRSFQGTVTYKF
ncbi:TonB-dependent siderophore receptor [Novosphingobium mangrovi (ex Huang et al. 2023)]|uniref:TonB-dependent receptor plug domain-containing protein n=1 Tax=Novosphingobium mangrovi (ex Huang et al. 2023) TaxID=2976432 RepID=A0ABT2I2D6_9SPHN|nr:TonB-dependent receptor [Novosphingobium mangrovi (ex Huang et al. 2023)]MCT2398965.1 TonB-dependent receptor plug domain-containing protein [Novosphingobium mangrovi (ex Huang et al. 2023)]